MINTVNFSQHLFVAVGRCPCAMFFSIRFIFSASYGFLETAACRDDAMTMTTPPV